MKQFSKFVGMDVHKATIAVSVADANGGEVDALAMLQAPRSAQQVFAWVAVWRLPQRPPILIVLRRSLASMVGNLATDAPMSPHLLVSNLKAEAYVASAENDDSYPPAMAKRLEKAFVEAAVNYRAEIYPAAHGWMVPDFPVYDHVAAERGEALFALLNQNFGDRAFAARR